ncbi:MAG: OsmC family protein [Ilumatobacteraceae bacterium]|nr:OsmC family protein [Ilumatobacteraceae bacterium]
MAFEVELRNVDGSTTALGTAGPHTVVVDRPADAGGGGFGFSGGQLLHLAVAGCISNDLFREAAERGIQLTRVVVKVDGGYGGDPVVSTGISYAIEIAGVASENDLQALVDHVDAIAEIPNSLRNGTAVRLDSVTATSTGHT